MHQSNKRMVPYGHKVTDQADFYWLFVGEPEAWKEAGYYSQRMQNALVIPRLYQVDQYAYTPVAGKAVIVVIFGYPAHELAHAVQLKNLLVEAGATHIVVRFADAPIRESGDSAVVEFILSNPMGNKNYD